MHINGGTIIDKPNPNDTAIRVKEFLYSDIYEDGLEQRIQEAHDALQTYYAEEDAKRAEFEKRNIANVIQR